MTATTVDTPTVPPAADAAGKNAEPATNATPDKTEVGVPTAKLLQDVSSALLLARRDISVLESQLLAARREVERAQARLAEHEAIFRWLQGEEGEFPESLPGKRYNFRTELSRRLAALAATPEEKLGQANQWTNTVFTRDELLAALGSTAALSTAEREHGAFPLPSEVLAIRAGCVHLFELEGQPLSFCPWCGTANGAGDDPESQLTAIRNRLAAATPRPWLVMGNSPNVNAGDGSEVATAWGGSGARQQANRDFIAHSRSDVEYLLAALSTVERERDELRDTLRYFVDRFSIQGTADSERYDRALALLARVPSGGEEGR